MKGGEAGRSAVAGRIATGRRIARGGRAAAGGRVAKGGPASLKVETRVSIGTDQDVVTARQRGRALAQRLGFPGSSLTLIATAISELARNILLYARKGDLILGVIEGNGRAGIAVVARDEGPGIPDVARALEVGYSTSGGLGLGLPGVRRLMDDFEIVTRVGRGTTVTARKWK